MASTKFSLILCVVVAIWAVDLAHGASSPTQHAPSPSVDCSSLVLTMADCLSFVTNDSTITKPEGTCCSGLKSVLKSAPSCLCEAFKSSAQFGVVLNVTKALTLPAACKVSAPSVTNCGCEFFYLIPHLGFFSNHKKKNLGFFLRFCSSVLFLLCITQMRVFFFPF